MFNYKQGHGFFSRFCKNEDGNLALTFALSLTLIVTAIGSATDFSALSRAHSKSQSIADSTALTAAIFVKNNNHAPGEDDTGILGGEHSAKSLGYEYKSSVDGGAENVKVEVMYDDDEKEVTVRVTGQTAPNFTQIFGRDRLPFTAESVASYLEIEEKFPASIALVLDNSGSMQFDDKLALNPRSFRHFYNCTDRFGRRRRCSFTHIHGDRPEGARIRLDGLKESVENFQTELGERLGLEDDRSRRTLRMGMLPYSSDVIADGTVEMDWGYLPVGTNGGSTGIRGMNADGGTNSSPPMSRARTWMQTEAQKHTTEAKRTNTEDKEPLKFVIFMTDGQNTEGNYEIIPGNTRVWYRINNNGTVSSRNSQRSGFTQGTLNLLTDAETLAACNQMKQDPNIQIFTIGYALEDAGEYRVNGWNNWEPERTFNVSQSVQTAAYNLMEGCASSPDHFIIAGDAGKLEAAFDEIQNAIVEELIRLKS